MKPTTQLKLGSFTQIANHPYVTTRRAVLNSRKALPTPVDARPAQASDPQGAADLAQRQLTTYGMGLLQLDRVMDNEQFLQFGKVLGLAQPEIALDLLHRVEDSVILNLRTEFPLTNDLTLQPFAANAIALHSEGSAKPVEDQTRYVIFMCVSSGSDNLRAQTIIAPMDEVHEALGKDERTLLAATAYNLPGVPMILRYVDERPVFSFRDFPASPLNWACTARDVDQSDVQGALLSLHTAMYSHTLYGIQWQEGMVGIIDNAHFFHGRTSSSLTTSAARYLKRIRIAAPTTTK